MAVWTNNNPTYYINPAYITFVENSGYGANLIQVSASSSCYISVYDPGNGIGYSDADKNYKRWKVTAYNNKFPSRDKFHVYVRLEKEGSSALIIYDTVLRGVRGGRVTIVVDENGNEIRTEEEVKDEDVVYYFILIGEVGSTDGVSIREIRYDTGCLTSDMVRDAFSMNEMWRLDKYSTPNLIEALYNLKSFVVRGFIKLVGGLIFKKGETEKTVTDIKRSIDSDSEFIFNEDGTVQTDVNGNPLLNPDYVPTSDETLPTTQYLQKKLDGIDDRYISKIRPDETEHRVKFKDGIEAGEFVSGLLGGIGAQIDRDGRGEMQSLSIREFLEVPELRFNRVDVVSGELWNSIAFGLVESVDSARRICTLKLEEGERSGLHPYDICRGIFSDFGTGSATEEGEDQNGFQRLYGFSTSYFTPTEILVNEDGKFQFRYDLQEGTSVHPCPSMKFAVYGNFIDETRRASAYSTRTYKRYLNKVNTWKIDPDLHICAQFGDLEGLTIGGYTMSGYGSFQNNVYLTNALIQFTPQQKEELKGEDAYSVVLSDYEGIVVIDDEGKIVGGDRMLMNVTTNGQNVVTLDPKDETKQRLLNVITSEYKLRTQVQAVRGNTVLHHSLGVEKNGYVIGIKPVGCTAMVINGVVVITSVIEPKNCYVDITVNCEGKVSFSHSYHITAVTDGKNPIVADLDNEMDSVACDSDGNVVFGLPVECKVNVWAGTKQLIIDRMVVVPPAGVTVVKKMLDQNGTNIEELDEIGKESIEYSTGVITIPAVVEEGADPEVPGITKEAGKSLPINITVYATYGKEQFHRDLVFTVNKVMAGENSVIYRLMPSVSSVLVEDSGTMTASSVTCKVTATDGRKVKVLEELPDGISVKYYLDKELPANNYAYGMGEVSINTGNKTVTFQLFSGEDLIDTETIPVIQDGSSPVVLDLDNEMQSVACDENGKVLLGLPLSTNVKMYYGNRELVISDLKVSAPTGVTASVSGTTVRVTSITQSADENLRIGITATGTYDKQYTRTAYLIVNKLKQGENARVLDLVPSVSVIKVDDAKKYTPVNISCKVKQTTGKQGATTPSSLPSGYSMKYALDNAATPSAYTYGKSISVTSLKTSITFYLYYGSTMVDRETIPVVSDAPHVFQSTVFCRTNEEPGIPSGGSYSSPLPEDEDETGTRIWNDGIPSGNSILWASTRIFTSDGNPPQQNSWTEPKQMTDTASFEVIYHTSQTEPAPPTNKPSQGAWTPGNGWTDDPEGEPIWMATSTMSNGDWSPWVVSKIKGEKGEDGVSTFKSTVFRRQNATPSAPTGGSYVSPIPTSTPEWFDGIPGGEEKLWASVCTFASNVDYSEQNVKWSTPRQMTDTASFEAVYHTSETQPNPPSFWPETPGDWTPDNGWTDDPQGDPIWMATSNKANGVWTPWVVSKIKGEKGKDAAYSFKSTVFIRTNDKPSVPTGGSYSSPIPTSTPKWSDGIPAGEEKLWASTRIFSSDGKSPQQNAWTTPRQMTDTASFEAVYHTSKTQPNPPSFWPETPGDWTPDNGWTDDPQGDPIWMATSNKANGVWTPWVVSKIKGEDGKDGTNALQLTCSCSTVGLNSFGAFDPSTVIVRSIRGGSPEKVYFTVYGKKENETPEPIKADGFYATSGTQWTLDLSKVRSAEYLSLIFRGYVNARITEWSTAPDSECSLGFVYDGKDGTPGPMPRNRGKWALSEVYVYNDEYRDFVWTDGGSVYMRIGRGENCPAGTPVTNTDYWTLASRQTLTAIDTALIDNANIAGFIFHRKDIVDGVPIGRLLSQNRTLVLDAQNSSVWLGESGNTIELSASERAIKLSNSSKKVVGELGFHNNYGWLELAAASGKTQIIGDTVEISSESASVLITPESLWVKKGAKQVFISEDSVSVEDGEGNQSILSPGVLAVYDKAGNSAIYDTSGGSGTGGGSGVVDQKVVEGSTNAVSGGAVYTALQEKIQTITDPTEAKYSGVLYIIH